MEFYENLDNLLRKHHLSAKSLSEASGISTANISRYRKGTRRPDPETANRLLTALGDLLHAQNVPFSEAAQESFRESLAAQERTFRAEHFDLLVTKLNICLTELAPEVGYSLAYVSNIKLGKRKPSDRERFLHGLCQYLTAHRQRESDRQVIRLLTGSSDLRDLEGVLDAWLWGENLREKNGMNDFLHCLDDFDLNHYMTKFHFETPEIPAHYDTSQLCRDYFGTEQMRQAELNFFRMTLLSDSSEPIFMHNEMSLSDMAEDMEFNKNWMLSIALCLKKGLHLHIIHDIDRPAEEMLLGLQAWIPLYMTGQISPYYLNTPAKPLYRNALYLSGAACLSGTCIQHDDACYTLTGHPDTMRAGAIRKVNALRAALPLMEIYRQETSGLYLDFLEQQSQREGKRISILPTLPFYTLSEELLRTILERHHANEQEQTLLLQALRTAKQHAEQIMQHSEITVVIPERSEAEFSVSPLSLDLTDSFFDQDYPCTFPEYQAHMELTAQFAEEHSQFRFILKRRSVFHNIQIRIKQHDWVMISKSNPPTRHFVIRHPKLASAIETEYVRQLYPAEYRR